MQLRKHARFLYQPVLPLGKNGKLVTNSKEHWKVALQTAEEGTVLLKNDGTLPLKQGAKICLFRVGASEFLFGGGGSGAVFTQHKITLGDALTSAAKRGEIEYFTPLAEFYTTVSEQLKKQALSVYPKMPVVQACNIWCMDHHSPLLELPDDLYAQAKAFGDTAVFCLSRYSAEGDGFGDRHGGKGDFSLLDEEQALLDRLCDDFARVIVVLNVCGPVSTLEYKENPKVGAVLYPMFGGGMAGEALVRILMGNAFPSGHLQDTLARVIEDYPSTKGFRDHGAAPEYLRNSYARYKEAPVMDGVNYTEDIFVGYRFFETFAPETVVYPFGFGLGYTTFDMETVSAKKEKFTVSLTVRVKNTGRFDGKQVAQVYLTAPQGKLGKAKKVLCAFGKTRTLKPGEQQDLKLHFDLREFASFDDLGKIAYCAFLLEQGEYTVHVGDNVRDTKQCFAFTLDEDVVCRKCHPYMAPRELEERLTADGTMEKLPKAQKVAHKPVGYRLKFKGTPEAIPLEQAYREDRLDEFLANMTDEELGEMLYGKPILNPSNTNGIGLYPREEVRAGERGVEKLVPLIPTADGPMGLRIRQGRGVLPTFFPCENTVSQSWNLPLAQRAATCIAMETKENNIGIWLAPALNIHRNPMCGRNFEYYSEDPLISGLFAGAVVKGVQSQHIAATVKHYCANNRETFRRLADARVSMRALREIYLRGFEIVVKKAHPWALMTSYNPVNGEQMSKNWEALNGILRSEWKYDGVIMTDWRPLSNIDEELHAGSDVKMPELITQFYKNAPEQFDLTQAIAEGKIDRGAVLASARRVLKLMEHLD